MLLFRHKEMHKKLRHSELTFGPKDIHEKMRHSGSIFGPEEIHTRPRHPELIYLILYHHSSGCKFCLRESLKLHFVNLDAKACFEAIGCKSTYKNVRQQWISITISPWKVSAHLALPKQYNVLQLTLHRWAITQDVISTGWCATMQLTLPDCCVSEFIVILSLHCRLSFRGSFCTPGHL